MSPEAQNKAIAEACGWTWSELHGTWSVVREGTREWYEIPPKYTSDLNAMHSAEKMLTDEQHVAFRGQLFELVGANDDYLPHVMWGSRGYVSATAAQRAKAFLKTLNLWVEE